MSLLIATTIVRAGTLVRMTVGGDEVSLPSTDSRGGSCEPCLERSHPGDRITLYASGGRIRRDRGPMSVILRKDTGKVYLVCHKRKQYSELGYPIRYAKLARRGRGGVPPELLRFELTAPGAIGRSQIKQWAVTTFEGTVVNGLRNQFRIRVAVADVDEKNEAPFLEFAKVLDELGSSGHGWSRLLPFERGMPVLWELAERQPDTEFVYQEEVTEIEERELPPETYEVPAAYREVNFDPTCEQFR